MKIANTRAYALDSKVAPVTARRARDIKAIGALTPLTVVKERHVSSVASATVAMIWSRSETEGKLIAGPSSAERGAARLTVRVTRLTSTAIAHPASWWHADLGEFKR